MDADELLVVEVDVLVDVELDETVVVDSGVVLWDELDDVDAVDCMVVVDSEACKELVLLGEVATLDVVEDDVVKLVVDWVLCVPVVELDDVFCVVLAVLAVLDSVLLTVELVTAVVDAAVVLDEEDVELDMTVNVVDSDDAPLLVELKPGVDDCVDVDSGALELTKAFVPLMIITTSSLSEAFFVLAATGRLPFLNPIILEAITPAV